MEAFDRKMWLETGAKKMDARSRYSRMRILEAAVQILHQKPGDKLTVTEICKVAEVNRTTFYRHFKDPYDLIDQMQDMVITGLIHLFDTRMDGKLEQLMESISKHIYQHRDMLSIFYRPTDLFHFLNKVATVFLDRFLECTREHSEQISDEERKMLYAYISGGAAAAYVHWIQTGMKENTGLVAHRMSLT